MKKRYEESLPLTFLPIIEPQTKEYPFEYEKSNENFNKLDIFYMTFGLRAHSSKHTHIFNHPVTEWTHTMKILVR